MPDDPIRTSLYMLLRRFYSEILIWAADFLCPSIKENETVDDLQQPLFIANLSQVSVQQVVKLLIGLLFPLQVVLLRRIGGTVSQTGRIITSYHQLHGIEERFDEVIRLIVQVLPDPFTEGDFGSLQFDHTDGYAIDIEDQIRALIVYSPDGYLLSNGKVVVVRILPIDQLYGLIVITYLLANRGAITEHPVDLLVAIIEIVNLDTRRFGKLEIGFVDEWLRIPLLLKKAFQVDFFNIAVTDSILPITQIVITQLLGEQLYYPVLGFTL